MIRRQRVRQLNLILVIIFTISAALLIRQLVIMGILPESYVALIGIGTVLWDVIAIVVSRSSRRGVRGIVTAVITILLCILMIFANVVLTKIHNTMLSITTVDDESADAAADEEDEEEDVELTEDESIFTVFISGIDDDGEIEDTVSRSDVNIIAVVNTITGEVQMINTPRDYYVYLPSKYAYDKLTHAGLYGIDCSMETLEYLYDVELDYYARINFTGFETLVDDIGGIDIYVEEDFVSNDGISYTAGWTHMDGYLALNYARERKAFSTGDVQRGENQMQVIEAIVDQMISSGMVLTNFTALLDDVSDMVQTNMTTKMIYDLIRYQLSSETDWDFSAYTVDGTSTRRSVYSTSSSVSVMLPDQSTVEEAKALIRAALGEEDETEESDGLTEDTSDSYDSAY